MLCIRFPTYSSYNWKLDQFLPILNAYQDSNLHANGIVIIKRTKVYILTYVHPFSLVSISGRYIHSFKLSVSLMKLFLNLMI